MISSTRKVLFLVVIALLQSVTLCQKSEKVEYIRSSSFGDGDDDDAASVEVHPSPPLSRQKRKATLIGLTLQRKIDIVNMHNKCRRDARPPAINMQYMEWEDELADIAQCHAQKCQFRHNNMEARKQHSSGVWLGQNLGAVFGHDKWMNVSGQVRGWYSEGNYWNFTTNKCTPGKQCGHYTIVVWPTTRWVGCGLAQCEPFDVTIQKRVTNVGTYLVCNYRPGGNSGIKKGEYVYKIGGNGPCSICLPGQTCAAGLCRTAGCSGKVCKKGELLKDVCICNSNYPVNCGGTGSDIKKPALNTMIFTALVTVLSLKIFF